MTGLTRPKGRLEPLVAAFFALGVVACTPPATVPTPVRPSGTAARPESSSSDASPGGPAATGTGGAAVSTATPGSSVGPPATSAVDGGTWQQLADFPASGAFAVTSVTAVGAGFVAVGFGAMPGEGFFGRHHGIVWRSDDGRAWTVEANPVFEFVTLEEVAALGDSVYAIGTIAMCDALLSDECVEPPESGWAVWRASSGGSWERLPQLPQMQSGNVDGVAVTSSSLVTFGSTGDEAQPIVWTSGDGTTWTATTELHEMTQVTAAASTPAGLVAFGSRFSEEIENVELVGATSADAVSFSPADVPKLIGSSVRSIASGPTGLVAVGDRETDDLQLDAFALHSADGATWQEVAAADGSFDDSAASFVHAVPDGYVAIGFVPTEGAFGSSTGTSWLSAEGTEWRALAPFGGEFTGLEASASGASGIVAFTVTSDEPTEETVNSTVAAWFLPH